MNPTDPKPSPPRPGLLRRTIRRWVLPIAALWIVGTIALLIAIAPALRPTYRAVSYLRVDPAATNLYGFEGVGDQLEPFLQTQVQLLTSPNVLTAAGTNPKASALPRIQAAGDVPTELRKALSVGVVPNTYLIEVAMASNSAYESATLVNAVVDAFLESSGEWSDGVTRSQIQKLEAYLSDLRNQSDEAERRWKELAAREDGIRVTLKDRAAGNPGGIPVEFSLEQYRRLQQLLFQVTLDLAQAQAQATALKAASMVTGMNAGSKAYELARGRSLAEPEAAQLAAQIATAKDDLEKIGRVALAPEDPAAVKARRRLDDLQAQLDRRLKERIPALRDEILAELDPERDLREADARARALLTQQEALQAQFARLEVDRGGRAGDAIDIELVRHRLMALQAMQEPVIKRLEQLKFEAKGEARIRQVHRAVPPGKPIADRRPWALAAAPLVMLPFAIAFFGCIEAFAGPRGRPATATKEEPRAEV